MENKRAPKPSDIAIGTKLALSNLNKLDNFDPPKTVSECSIYTVVNCFHYYDIYPKGLNEWSTFVVINNDYGKKIKMNLKRFKIL